MQAPVLSELSPGHKRSTMPSLPIPSTSKNTSHPNYIAHCIPSRQCLSPYLIIHII